MSADDPLSWLGDETPENADEDGVLADVEEEAAEQYATTGEFVHGYLVARFPKPVQHKHHWCPYWWEHEEAVENFTALWREYERAYAADEIAGYLRDYHYPLMDRMLGHTGPFSECHIRDGRHEPKTDMAPLLTVDLPDGI